jgi:hypothetical protein
MRCNVFDVDFNGIFDEMLEQMQTPAAKKAMTEAFNATPEELGAAAVEQAQKE